MFELRDIGTEDWTVVIPGWAFDYRVFAGLNWRTNVALWQGTNLETLPEVWSQTKWAHVTLVGWSMGAYPAVRLALQQEIEHLVLVSARPFYPLEQLTRVREAVTRNATVFLRKFYHDGFGRTERDLYRDFQRQWQPDYLKRFTAGRLLADLDWMGRQRLEATDLRTVKRLTIVHGRADAIAPWPEMEALAVQLPQAEVHCLDGVGHLPFLHEGFMDRL